MTIGFIRRLQASTQVAAQLYGARTKHAERGREVFRRRDLDRYLQNRDPCLASARRVAANAPEHCGGWRVAHDDDRLQITWVPSRTDYKPPEAYI